MRFRKLRIAWSAVCTVACLLLIALWVRSYWIADRLHWPLWGKQTFVVASMQGRVALLTYESRQDPNEWKSGYYHHRVDDNQAFPGGWQVFNSALGFGFIRQPLHYMPEVVVPMTGKPPGWNTWYNAGYSKLNGSGVVVPDWFLALASAALSAALWFKWSRRFSLRTLLVVTTLMAVVLGLAVYAARE